MKNKSYLYYLLVAIVLIVVTAALLWFGKAKPVAPQLESGNLPTPGNSTLSNPDVAPAANEEQSNANNPAPATGEPAVPGVNGPVPATNSASASGLVGTWTSSVAGKGMQGSGKVELNGITYELSLAGDVSLVINKAEDKTGTGTITFNNVCISGTKSVAGKAATAISPQCAKSLSRPAEMQVDGNKISWSGQSDLGADITLTGTYAGDSMSGTFARTSKQGNIDGTFSLAKTK